MAMLNYQRVLYTVNNLNCTPPSSSEFALITLRWKDYSKHHHLNHEKYAIMVLLLAVFLSTINHLPSGKHTKNYGTSPFLMGKSTISIAIFHNKQFSVSPLTHQEGYVEYLTSLLVTCNFWLIQYECPSFFPSPVIRYFYSSFLTGA